jgi:hypothetical protein
MLLCAFSSVRPTASPPGVRRARPYVHAVSAAAFGRERVHVRIGSDLFHARGDGAAGRGDVHLVQTVQVAQVHAGAEAGAAQREQLRAERDGGGAHRAAFAPGVAEVDGLAHGVAVEHDIEVVLVEIAVAGADGAGRQRERAELEAQRRGTHVGIEAEAVVGDVRHQLGLVGGVEVGAGDFVVPVQAQRVVLHRDSGAGQAHARAVAERQVGRVVGDRFQSAGHGAAGAAHAPGTHRALGVGTGRRQDHEGQRRQREGRQVDRQAAVVAVREVHRDALHVTSPLLLPPRGR